MNAQNNMQNKVSSDEVLKIAQQHLEMQVQKKYEGKLGINDGVPDGLPLYMLKTAREHCWCIFVPQIEHDRIGAGRYICISKETGQVIFDG